MGKAEGRKELWHGHVTAVTVAPEYRRLGVAKQLMDSLETVRQTLVMIPKVLMVVIGTGGVTHLYNCAALSQFLTCYETVRQTLVILPKVPVVVIGRGGGVTYL